jgi:hypothetical protein
MAKTVFLFGAGASTTVGVPVMKDFIDRAHELAESRPPGLDLSAFELFFELVQSRLPQLHAKSVVDLTNIESVFSLVEMASLVRRLPGTTPEEIDKTAVAVRRVLTQTVQFTCQFDYTKEQAWMPPDAYLTVVGLAEHPDTKKSNVAFITFNYDLALDFALHWSQVEYDYGLGPSRSGTVPLLKLHGSLNWSRCSKCHAISPVTLDRVFRAMAGRVSITRTIRRSIDAPRALRSLPAHCADAARSEDPAIVPPSWNKTQYHATFSQVWSRAAQELSEAEEITVIGYSLPESDAFSRDLFRLAMAGSTRLKSFTVVDTGSEGPGRFKDLLGPDAKGRFHHIPEGFREYAERHLPKNPRAPEWP